MLRDNRSRLKHRQDSVQHCGDSRAVGHHDSSDIAPGGSLGGIFHKTREIRTGRPVPRPHLMPVSP